MNVSSFWTTRFKGLDKTEFLDNRKEFGNVFSLLIKAQRFFRDHLLIR